MPPHKHTRTSRDRLGFIRFDLRALERITPSNVTSCHRSTCGAGIFASGEKATSAKRLEGNADRLGHVPMPRSALDLMSLFGELALIYFFNRHENYQLSTKP